MSKTDLVRLSQELGLESRQLAILGEGNTSTLVDEGTFLVKASGSSLATLSEADISLVKLDFILELLEHEHLNEEAVEDALRQSTLHPNDKKPSVETFLHALCLTVGGARWVGHTHTVSVNQLLCSSLGAEPFQRHIMPDAIVVCGLHVAVIPYVDPGFALAKAVKQGLETFIEQHGKPPKAMLLENHGPVALGQSAKEVMNIMLMLDKWAKVLAGCYAVGAPRFLPDTEAARIDQRLDEQYRRQAIGSA